MKVKSENLTYDQAYNELKAISELIQNETVTVDELAGKIKRASELITFCQNKLRTTEQEVELILKNLGNTQEEE
jgi:exodeoxyribonuclease VII small subunit